MEMLERKKRSMMKKKSLKLLLLPKPQLPSLRLGLTRRTTSKRSMKLLLVRRMKRINSSLRSAVLQACLATAMKDGKRDMMGWNGILG